MGILLSNTASSLLALPLLAGDTAMTIAASDAARFPQPLVGGDYFYLVIEDRRLVPNLREVVKCTARAGAALTIVRAQEGTTASPFFTGALADLRLTRQTLLDLRAEEAAARAAADTAETAARAAADAAETAARIAADAAEASARATAITNEQTTRAAADTAETAARIAAANAEVVARNAAITAGVAGEATIRATGDAALQTQCNNILTNLNNEVTARTAAVTAEATARAAAVTAVASSLVMKALGGLATTDTLGFLTVAFSPPFTAQAYVTVSAITSTSTNPVMLITSQSVSGFSLHAYDGAIGGSAAQITLNWTACGV